MSAINYMKQDMPIIIAQAKKYGIPLQQAINQVQQESGGNPLAISYDKQGRPLAFGAMQLLPSTAAGLGVKDVFNAHQNISGGMRDDASLYRQFGSWDLALAAYNAGSGTVAKLMQTYGNSYAAIKAHLPSQTQSYVANILGGKSGGNSGTGVPLGASTAWEHFLVSSNNMENASTLGGLVPSWQQILFRGAFVLLGLGLVFIGLMAIVGNVEGKIPAEIPPVPPM